MSILNTIGLALGVLLSTGVAFAQNPSVDPPANDSFDEPVNSIWKPSLVKDGVIDRVPHVNKPVDMVKIREVDAAWAHRVWRQIDIREKQNQAFIYEGDDYTGGGAFIEILLDAVKKGKIQAYGILDDRFTQVLDMEAFNTAVGGTWDTVDVPDINTGEITQEIRRREFDVNSVTRFRLKEDWVFDRNTGRLTVQIVGLAPLQDQYDPNTGAFLYSGPLFWLYYPDLRKVLANYEVYNPQNMLHRMTWADYFDGRYFSSYIIKSDVNNPRGLDLERNLRGLEEGQRIMEMLMAKEDDMWQR